jgi:hypothetical protein
MRSAISLRVGVFLLGLALTPAAPVSAAAESASPEAKALFAKVVESLGGMESIRKVKAVREKATLFTKAPTGDQTIDVDAWSSVAAPARQSQRLTISGVVYARVVTPEDAFMSSPMGVMDMPAAQKEMALRDLRMSAIAVAQKLDDPKLSLSVSPGVRIGAVETKLVTVRIEKDQVKWYVDPATGRILRRAVQAGPIEQSTDYSDFRTTGGMTIAFKRTITAPAQEPAVVTLIEYEVNPTADPARFARPAK